MITATKYNERIWFLAVRRGVEYHARLDPLNRWELSIRRLALGHRHVPSVRYYPTVADLEAATPAFAGLVQLLSVSKSMDTMQ